MLFGERRRVAVASSRLDAKRAKDARECMALPKLTRQKESEPDERREGEKTDCKVDPDAHVKSCQCGKNYDAQSCRMQRQEKEQRAGQFEEERDPRETSKESRE